MVRSTVLVLFLCSIAQADPSYSIFVPEASGVPGKYHDKDIRKAFPGLAKSDTKLSVCTNSMMSGASAITYIGAHTDRDVILKKASCKTVAHGLKCQSLEQSKAFYFESPGQTFGTVDVPYDEAVKVISAYKAHGIGNAPDYVRGWTYRQVRIVGRTAHGFRLVMGEFLCAGCMAKVDVTIDEGGNLVLEQVVEAICI
jgi:hypothetical protein